MVNKKLKKRLQTLYYSPKLPTGYTGDSRKLPGPKKAVEKWLSYQDSWTLHRPLQRQFRRRRIVSFGIGHIWEADLIDVQQIKKYNRPFGFILVAIDIFSKKAWGVPVKNKTATVVADGFERLLELNGGKGPYSLRTDMGKEFLGNEFQKMLRRHNIHHYFADNPDTKAAVIERFIQSLRRPMYRFFSRKGGLKRYIDVLPALLTSYNNRVHSSTKKKPSEVTYDNQDEVRENLYGTSKLITLMEGTDLKQLPSNTKLRTARRSFPIGSFVRISKYKSIVGKRGYLPNYTSEIFRVIHRNPTVDEDIKRRGKRTLYTLIDRNGQVIQGRFYSEELVRHNE